jgi:plasmid stabilization system protein ParE
VADQFLQSVYETANTLQSFPHAGTLCGVHSPKLKTLRRFPLNLPFGNWLIIYLVYPDRILILRVLHGAQDWKRLFP